MRVGDDDSYDSYEPGEFLLGAGSDISTLEMTAAEKRAAAERLRRRGAFGFARALELDPGGDPPPAP